MILLKSFFKESESTLTSLPDWSPQPTWSAETINLLEEVDIPSLSEISLDTILDKSENFPINFPTTTNRCKHLKTIVEENVLVRNINSTYPILHEKVLKLCCDFLLFKRSHGTDKEQKFFKNINLTDLINRLLSKRSVVFVGARDSYMLLDGTEGFGGWETIGTPEEKYPLVIENYLSYDELKLSALIAVSSYTYFINEGHRRNQAVYQQCRNEVETEGVIIGLVGPRLHKTNAMENQEIIFSERERTRGNGFGRTVKCTIPKLFADFYDDECLDFKEMLKIKKSNSTGRYTYLSGGQGIFDNYLYYKRLIISIDTLLGEANSRGKNASKSAFVHVVGLGLGVWKASLHQDQIFLDTFSKRVHFLGDKLYHISDLCFAYIKGSKCGDYSDKEIIPIEGHPKGGIKIHIFNRRPHDKLTGDDEDKLLVVSYAWDGNALPGNEYWFDSLASSSDPAAACSTQITELHNSHINPLVCAENLRIATNGDVITLQEYRQRINCK